MEHATFVRDTDQPALPDWRDDPGYHDAAAAAEAADRLNKELDAEFHRLAKAAQPDGVIHPPPPGHPVWDIRYQANEAEKAAKAARIAQAEAEQAAKATTQRAGEEAGRAKWLEAEAEVFPRLIAWLREYEVLRAEVRARTGVLLPEISCAICLSAGDVRTFCDNMRREFGG